MMILQVHDVTKEFGATPVLKGVSLHLAAGERVGLVGANGCGKSTLMKIVAGQLKQDAGSVNWVMASPTVASLAQEGHWQPHLTLGEQLGGIPADLLSRCGVTPAMLAQPAGSLSGGEKTRAALARVLANRPQLLLLDEPTNHLDMEGLEWLEQMLCAYKGTVLVVSHDRHFLDRVVSRILEMSDGVVKEYPGNYSAYAQQKRAEQERAEFEYRQYLNTKRQLEEAMRRQIQWATAAHNAPVPAGAPPTYKEWMKGHAKAHMQVAKAIEKRIERAKVERPKTDVHMNMKLAGSEAGGRNQILAQNLGYSWDTSRWLFRHSDFYVQRGDRLAIVGPNGAGKSTLVRLITGALSPSEGSLYRSPLRIGYLEQELAHLDPALTILEEATGNSALDQATARTLLGCLLFPGEAVLKQVGSLSGGERVRLALAKILLSAPDVLVLDEPTNGLDLPSRERMEEALESYPGTMLFISHDRYLLERLATRVLELKGGRLTAYPGTYVEYRQRSSGGLAADDTASRRLLLETRIAQLSAALANPPEGEGERLTAEFIRLSRELQALRR
ncbi:MAG: ribosomal protection-like ABC-F family protein [Mycobacterium leprae]